MASEEGPSLWAQLQGDGDMGKFSSDRFCFLSGIGSNTLVESGGERGNYESGK